MAKQKKQTRTKSKSKKTPARTNRKKKREVDMSGTGAYVFSRGEIVDMSGNVAVFYDRREADSVAQDLRESGYMADVRSLDHGYVINSGGKWLARSP
jgi:hypothetical protein